MLADETSLEAARREYSEEIGITLNQDSFHFLTSRMGNRCFYDIYYVRKNLNLSELKLQEEEVTDACWYSMDAVSYTHLDVYKRQFLNCKKHPQICAAANVCAGRASPISLSKWISYRE